MTTENLSKPLLPKIKTKLSKIHLLFVYIGIFLTVSIASLSLPCVQVLDDVIPRFELNALRFGGQLTLMIPVVGWSKCDVGINVSKKQCPTLILLFLSNVIGNLLYFSAATYLPVGTLLGLLQTSALLCNVVISIFKASDRHIFLYIAALVSSMGCLFITQPVFMFGGSGLYVNTAPTNWTSPCKETVIIQNLTDTASTTFNQRSENIWIGVILISLAGLNDAARINLTQYIVQFISPKTLSFWMSITGILGSLPPMIIMEKVTWVSGALCNLLLIVHIYTIGLLGVVTIFCMEIVNPGVFLIIEFTFELLLLFIYQYTFLKDIFPVKGNWLEIVGAVTCVAGIAIGPIWKIKDELNDDCNQATDLDKPHGKGEVCGRNINE